MRSTLFYIPHEDPWLHVPVLGLGWLLLVWIVVSVILLVLAIRKHGRTKDTLEYVPVLLVLGAAIMWVGPLLEQQTAAGLLVGVPIRGYGVMLLLGVVCGVAVAADQARHAGVDPEVIFSLAFWIFIGGLIGARMLFVLEYWEQFSRPTLRETLIEIVKLTEGGLIVYGSLIGATIAAILFMRRHRLPMLAIGDLVAPGLMIGLALGRIGCLLNGCCWGGYCDGSALAITFPPGSPPYMDQLERGSLLGMRLELDPATRTVRRVKILAFFGCDVYTDPETGTRIVRRVKPGSLAARQQLKPGDRILGVEFPRKDELNRMRHGEKVDDALVTITTGDGRRISWQFRQLPRRSQPIYPAQILASINAALICWFLWAYYPLRRRDGEVLALMLTIYPVTRFLLEMIRSDEPSLLPTSFKLTMSQSISGILIVLVVALWAYLWTRPKGSV